MSRRVAIYCRISRDRTGAHLGVDRQEEDCRSKAEHLGWTVATVNADNDLSAYSGKPRPGYQALLDHLRAGRADAVIAWHTDRLHRSPAELEEFISICEAHGVMVQTVKAGEIDLATPSGRAVARTLGAWARHEVEHMIERQQRAKQQAAEAGKYRGGRRAFGYLSDGLTIDEPEAEIIREMARRVLEGESLRSIARDLTERGSTGTFGAAWTGASVRDVLIKPRTAGLIEHHGEVAGEALWPAVLPSDTWRAVRAVLTAAGRSRTKSAPRRWLMSGLAVCGLEGCGLPVRITAQKSSNGKTQRPNYRCSGRPVHVSRAAQHVDDLVTAVVVGRLAKPDAATLLRPRTPLVDIGALHTEGNGIRSRMNQLAELFAADTITLEQLTSGTAGHRTRLAQLDQLIADAVIASPLDGLIGAEDVEAVWSGLSLDTRRTVVDALVTVTILPGRRGRKVGGHYFDPASVRIEWKAPGAD
jgi:site-specific DNA recombinase